MPFTCANLRTRIIGLSDPNIAQFYNLRGLPTVITNSNTVPFSAFGTAYTQTSLSIPYYSGGVLTTSNQLGSAAYYGLYHPFSGSAPSGWPSDGTNAWQKYTGSFTNNDDGYASTAIPLGFTWWHNGSTYTSLYVSTNGYVTFGSGLGSIYSGSSVPGQNAIMGNPADQWLQPGLAMRSGNEQNIFYRTTTVTLDSTTHYIFQLLVYQGRYGDSTKDESYIINLFSRGSSQQFIEVTLRPEAQPAGGYQGPVCPGVTITRSIAERGNSKVWESTNQGTSWTYHGVGCVMLSQQSINQTPISIRTLTHNRKVKPISGQLMQRTASVTTLGSDGTTYYGSGLKTHTYSTVYRAQDYGGNNGDGFCPAPAYPTFYEYSNQVLRVYLGKADTSNGHETYIKNTTDPNFGGYNYFNTTRGGTYSYSVSLSDSLNHLKIYLAKTFNQALSNGTTWTERQLAERVNAFAGNTVLPGLAAGSYANGNLWTRPALPYLPYYPDPKKMKIRLSHAGEGDANNYVASGDQKGFNAVPAEPYKITRYAYNANTICGYWGKLYSSQNIAVSSYKSGDFYGDTYYTGVSQTANFHNFGLAQDNGINNPVHTYMPVANSSWATNLSSSYAFSNHDGTANSATISLSCGSAGVDLTYWAAIIFDQNGHITRSYTMGGSATSDGPSKILSYANTVYYEQYLASHFSVQFTGTITLNSGITAFVFDDFNPIRTSTSITSSYYPLNKMRAISINNGYCPVARWGGGGEFTESNTTPVPIVGGGNSITGTITIRDNWYNTSITRAFSLVWNT